MKRRPLHALLALAVASSFVACDKKPDASANPPAKPAEPAKPGEPAKPAEPAKTTATEPAAAPANVSAISAAYGFAAILPKDVEAFSANYRLHDLWVKLSTSNWSKTLLNMPGLKDDAKFQDMLAQWNSPMGMKGRDIF